MTQSPSIVWFRQDLRLADNPALAAALALGGPVVATYIQCRDEEGAWPPGAASDWWLHRSLKSLKDSLQTKGVTLVLRQGSAEAALEKLIHDAGASAVFWNRRYEPAAVARDSAVKAKLLGRGVHTESFNGSLLFEPWEIRTQGDAPYKVFTPFWKACLRRPESKPPMVAPKRLPSFPGSLDTLALEDLALEPKIPWDGGLRKAWSPGEAGAWAELEKFCESRLVRYLEDRDRPSLIATSRLSPHLHFGEISPRQIWHAIQESSVRNRKSGVQRGAEGYLRELGWREFAYYLLYHFPATIERPLRAEFERFPWRQDSAALRAWQKGRTGYPIVDAGMRELWKTGWMHNRVRMIVASFLVKDLLQPWQEGAKWFWDTLVDADLANNTLGWQWTAGCGADAAPYFRIFNPISQGEKFDPKGDYVRRWVPELSALPDKFVHCPWQAPEEILTKAGLCLGKNYPRPVVDHAEARALALHAFATIKKK